MMRSFAVVAALLAGSISQAGTVLIATSMTEVPVTDDVTLRLGETRDLFVWWDPDRGEPINGASIDILTSEPGVLDATDASVFNPTLGPFGPRWNGTNNGSTDPGDSAALVEGMLGVSVNAEGLDPIRFTDFGIFDPLAFVPYFVFSMFTVEATAVGSTTVSAGPNALNPITAQGHGAIDVDFAGIRVIVVPEPATTGLVALVSLFVASVLRDRAPSGR